MKKMRETEGFLPQLFILHYSSFIIHYWVYRKPINPNLKATLSSVAFPYPIQSNPFSTLPHSSQKLSRSAVSVAVMGISPKASPLQV